MKKNTQKIFAVAIIAFFMLLSLTPATSATKEKKLGSIGVEVTDYLADGTSKTRKVFLERSDIKDLKNDILSAKTISERIEVLKKFNLVEEDKSALDWLKGMLERADKLGIRDKNFLTRTKIKLPFMISALNKVSSVSIVGGSTRIGVTPLFRIIKKLFKLDQVTRADLLVTQTGILSILDTKSVLSKNTMISLLGFTGHIGFVGTGIKVPFLLHIHTGYSALSFGLGLGFRIKRSNLKDVDIPDVMP